MELGINLCYLTDMAEHRYTIGDLVRVRENLSAHPVGRFRVELNDNKPIGVGIGIHEITRLLPELLNGEPQYQITSLGDRADHVVREVQLIALPLPPRRY